MFNLNIPPSSLLGIDGTGGLSSTPKTPEIVNSLIAMTNPMDNYNFSTAINSSTASTPGSIVTVRNFNNAQNAQSISQDSSHSSCSASPLNSPAGTNTTPSVQQTCSQLIKAGLKLSIQSKRKLSTCDSSSGSEQPNSKCARRDEDCDETTDDDSENKSTAKGLTPEDEDRRRRRRERNKIAATKCRMKKRERTQNLIKESEQLDTQNIDLKTQVRALELERRKLLEMLQAHSPTCIRRGGFSLPSKLLQSPAFKYLAELNLDGNNCSGNSTPAGTPASGQQTEQQQQQLNGNVTTPQRTAIPPMSTIKFSRSNGFKAVAAAAAAAAVTAAASANGSIVTSSQQQQQQQQQQHLHQLPAQTSSPTLHHHHQQQLPNGYCKPSPTAQELGYLNSPSQDSICLASMQPQPHHQQQQQQQQQHAVQTPTAHQITTSSAADAVTVAIVNQQLNDYIPNCDNSLGLGLTSSHTHTPTCSTPTNSSGDNSVLLGGGLVSPMTPTTATEFVKNELVDSSSPYTTAQSAERFLFENNCDSFVDIKHAVSVHLGSSILSGNHHHNNNNNNNNNSSSHNNHNSNSIGGLSSLIHTNGISNIINNSNNNSNSLLDFHPSLMCNGVNGSGIVSFHDQISIKNDYLHEADLLAQLTGDAAEFVDLDTGVSAAFMTNGGCLA